MKINTNRILPLLRPTKPDESMDADEYDIDKVSRSRPTTQLGIGGLDLGLPWNKFPTSGNLKLKFPVSSSRLYIDLNGPGLCMCTKPVGQFAQHKAVAARRPYYVETVSMIIVQLCNVNISIKQALARC